MRESPHRILALSERCGGNDVGGRAHFSRVAYEKGIRHDEVHHLRGEERVYPVDSQFYGIGEERVEIKQRNTQA